MIFTDVSIFSSKDQSLRGRRRREGGVSRWSELSIKAWVHGLRMVRVEGTQLEENLDPKPQTRYTSH